MKESISKVEIEGLWNRYDLEWDLRPDVNILSGINGSGKSTILDCISFMMVGLPPQKPLVRKCKLNFREGKYLQIESKEGKLWTYNFFTPSREVCNLTTISNRKLFHLILRLNMVKKALKIKVIQRFLEIIDSLFSETDKRIDRAKNEVWFLSGDKEISPYELSSGEKRVLVILLTVLVQDNKPSIFFMDTPEKFLHIDWQRKLIAYILELNPNVQIILATHSPGFVIEGWTDRVFDVRDLITKDYLKN